MYRQNVRSVPSREHDVNTQDRWRLAHRMLHRGCYSRLEGVCLACQLLCRCETTGTLGKWIYSYVMISFSCLSNGFVVEDLLVSLSGTTPTSPRNTHQAIRLKAVCAAVALIAFSIALLLHRLPLTSRCSSSTAKALSVLEYGCRGGHSTGKKKNCHRAKVSELSVIAIATSNSSTPAAAHEPNASKFFRHCDADEGVQNSL